jgi:hypothetical protein
MILSVTARRVAPFAALLLLLAPSLAAAQGGGMGQGQRVQRDTVRRVLTIPGQRDGTSTFPLTNYEEMKPKQWGVMDFEHYHTTEELNYWMDRWATEKPDIVEKV